MRHFIVDQYVCIPSPPHQKIILDVRTNEIYSTFTPIPLSTYVMGFWDIGTFHLKLNSKYRARMTMEGTRACIIRDIQFSRQIREYTVIRTVTFTVSSISNRILILSILIYSNEYAMLFAYYL